MNDVIDGVICLPKVLGIKERGKPGVPGGAAPLGSTPAFPTPKPQGCTMALRVKPFSKNHQYDVVQLGGRSVRGRSLPILTEGQSIREWFVHIASVGGAHL
jgi:hypothetical protein